MIRSAEVDLSEESIFKSPETSSTSNSRLGEKVKVEPSEHIHAGSTLLLLPNQANLMAVLLLLLLLLLIILLLVPLQLLLLRSLVLLLQMLLALLNLMLSLVIVAVAGGLMVVLPPCRGGAGGRPCRGQGLMLFTRRGYGTPVPR